MKSLNIRTGLSLMVGVLLTKTHSILYYFYPESKDVYVSDWFIIPQPNVNLLWYLKGVTDDLFLCIIFYVLAQVGKLIHRRLFHIASIFFLYYIFNVGMFFYNYKQSHWLFHVAFGIVGLVIEALIHPDKKQKGKVKEIKHNFTPAHK